MLKCTQTGAFRCRKAPVCKGRSSFFEEYDQSADAVSSALFLYSESIGIAMDRNYPSATSRSIMRAKPSTMPAVAKYGCSS